MGKIETKPAQTQHTLLANPAAGNLKAASATPSTVSSSSSLFADDPELFVQPSLTNSSAAAKSTVTGVKPR